MEVASGVNLPAAAAGVERWLLRLDVVGTAVAVGFFCLSLTPSLLPRPWYLQGVISGILAATGYLAGVALGALGRRLTRRPRRSEPPRRAWRRVGVGAAVAVPVFLWQGATWQGEIHELMGLDAPSRFGSLGVLVVAAAVVLPLVAVARALRAAARRLERLFARWIPAAVARGAGAAVVAILTVALLNGLVANGLVRAANNTFKALNDETDTVLGPPADPLRSGSARSLVSWASLGRQGRRFVVGGPSAAELGAFSGRDPAAPIRVYAGVDSADTIEERAALAVAELERTEAFSRAVLCVITTTGTGWIDRRLTDPLEYLYNGDTALVTIQYSYLPSFMSILVDPDRARAAGRELFNQVYDRWSELPAPTRPKLVVMGKSLGAFGAESAFSGVDDMRNRTDGILFVGAPYSADLRREFTGKRDPGSAEVLPVYEQGATVRFAGKPSDLDRPGAPWTPPRVVYLQHPSDPVVWWTPRMILTRPGWLKEPRGADVLGTMRWYPFVTFWQLTADLAFSLDAPTGHGHNYGTEAVAAWARIVPPPGWSDDRTAALRTTIHQTR